MVMVSTLVLTILLLTIIGNIHTSTTTSMQSSIIPILLSTASAFTISTTLPKHLTATSTSTIRNPQLWMIASIHRGNTASNGGGGDSSIDTALSEQTMDILNKSPYSKKWLSTNNMFSILDDGYGHINSELASSIWNWENSQRLSLHNNNDDHYDSNNDNDNDPYPASRLRYSTRDGLRLVHEIANEFDIVDRSSANNLQQEQHYTYADLIQEGVIALMSAMVQYQPSSSSSTSSTASSSTTTQQRHHHQSFESYARKKITQAMSRTMAETARPVQLPTQVYTVLSNARHAYSTLAKKLGRVPTLSEIAHSIHVKETTLSFYQLLARSALRMDFESVVEEEEEEDISSGDEKKALFTNLEFQQVVNDLETRHLHPISQQPIDEENDEDIIGTSSSFSTSSDTTTSSSSISGSNRQSYNHDGIVAPLRNFIADENPTPDDIALADMIRHDIRDFLTRTLNERELFVIRMRFGLSSSDDDNNNDNKEEDYGSSSPRKSLKIRNQVGGMTLGQLGKLLHLSPQRVGQIEQIALEKLRTSFRNDYIGVYLDDSDHAEEVSV